MYLPLIRRFRSQNKPVYPAANSRLQSGLLNCYQTFSVTITTANPSKRNHRIFREGTRHFSNNLSHSFACAALNALTIIIAVSNMAEASRPLKLEEFLKKELNTTKCQGLALASGGCISEGRSFDTDHGKIFVKVNAKSEVIVTS